MGTAKEPEEVVTIGPSIAMKSAERFLAFTPFDPESTVGVDEAASVLEVAESIVLGVQ